MYSQFYNILTDVTIVVFSYLSITKKKKKVVAKLRISKIANILSVLDRISLPIFVVTSFIVLV